MTHPDQSLSLQPAAGWQPIATAPKDGREVILAVKMRAGIKHGLLIGHYMGGGHCIEDHPPIDAGWYFWDGCMFDKASAPTHWLPMPHHPDWEPGGWEARRQPDPMIVHPVAPSIQSLPLEAASPRGGESIRFQAEMNGASMAARDVARGAAFIHRKDHDYLPQTGEAAMSWEPHDWVISAMQRYSEAMVLQVPVVEAASPQGSAAALDAARYQWLRDHSEPAICAFYLSVGMAFKDVRFTRETVDSAIDHQIAAHALLQGTDAASAASKEAAKENKDD